MTGKLDGENCYGLEKLRRVQRYLAAEAAGLPVICYSDNHSDLPLLRFATTAVAVNPTAKMRQFAVEFEIAIEDWR